MSIKASTWAWKQPVSDPGAKLVLLCLADHMNGQSGRCHPSVPTIAKMTGQSVRTVQRKLQLLTEIGLVRIERRSQGVEPLSNAYALAMEGRGWCHHDTTWCQDDSGVSVSPGGDTVGVSNEPEENLLASNRGITLSEGQYLILNRRANQGEVTRAHTREANGQAWMGGQL